MILWRNFCKDPNLNNRVEANLDPDLDKLDNSQPIKEKTNDFLYLPSITLTLKFSILVHHISIYEILTKIFYLSYINKIELRKRRTR